MRSTPGGGQLKGQLRRGPLAAALVRRSATARRGTAGRRRRRRRRPRRGRRPRFERAHLCRACRRCRSGAEARPHVHVVCGELEEIILLQAAGSSRGAAAAGREQRLGGRVAERLLAHAAEDVAARVPPPVAQPQPSRASRVARGAADTEVDAHLAVDALQPRADDRLGAAVAAHLLRTGAGVEVRAGARREGRAEVRAEVRAEERAEVRAEVRAGVRVRLGCKGGGAAQGSERRGLKSGPMPRRTGTPARCWCSSLASRRKRRSRIAPSSSPPPSAPSAPSAA